MLYPYRFSCHFNFCLRFADRHHSTKLINSLIQTLSCRASNPPQRQRTFKLLQKNQDFPARFKRNLMETDNIMQYPLEKIFFAESLECGLKNWHIFMFYYFAFWYQRDQSRSNRSRLIYPYAKTRQVFKNANISKISKIFMSEKFFFSKKHFENLKRFYKIFWIFWEKLF